MDNEKDLLEETENEQEEVLENAKEEESLSAEEPVSEEESVSEEDSQKKQKSDKVIYICSSCNAICETPHCDHCQQELTEENAYICKNKKSFEKSKKVKKILISSIAGVAVITGAVWGGLYWYNQVYNPYNHGEFKDLAFGIKLGEDAKKQKMGYAAYLEINGYKSDLPENTYKNIADQYVPLKDIISSEMLENADITIPEFTATFDISGTFNEKSIRGSFEKDIKIRDYFNIADEKDLAQFKEEYGITADITLDTKFKDIRADIYRYLNNNKEITIADVSESLYNLYNHSEFKDLAFGTTLGEEAKNQEISYNTYLEINGYELDFPENTYKNIADQYTPLGDILTEELLSKADLTIKDFVAAFDINGTFDENVPCGKFENELTIKEYFNIADEKGLNQIKAEYGITDDITLDTKFKDIRADIYKYLEKSDADVRENLYNPYREIKNNPYNHEKYQDVAFGTTIGEIAEDYMMPYDEFLSQNGLPADMPKSTYEYIAICYIPIKPQAAQYGMDVSQFIKEAYGLEGTFDENITRGEIEELLPISKAFYLETEEDLAKIKAEYGLDDSVTMDTPFAKVRATIYRKNEADKVASEKENLEQTVEDAKENLEQTAEAAAQDAIVEN